MFFSLFIACTATITVYAPKTADVYIVKDQMPSKNERPPTFVCKDKGEVKCPVRYYAWEQYYYSSYDVSGTKIGEVHNELKPVPAVLGIIGIGSVIGWFPLIWAWGPSESYIALD